MKASLSTWNMSVVVTPLVEPEDMDPNDREDSPVGTHDFFVDAGDSQEAASLALDQFHATIPMSRPEHFDIDVNPSIPFASEAVVIEVCERNWDGYHAQVAGKKGRWGAGDNAAEAVGSLVCAHPELFGAQVEYLTDVKR